MTDLARYLILRVVGGVYADIDVYNLNSLDQMLGCTGTKPDTLLPFLAVTEGIVTMGDAFITSIQGKRLRQRRVGNYFFATTPWSKTINAITALALNRTATHQVSRQADILYTTGPDAMTEGVYRHVPIEKFGIEDVPEGTILLSQGQAKR